MSVVHWQREATPIIIGFSSSTTTVSSPIFAFAPYSALLACVCKSKARLLLHCSNRSTSAPSTRLHKMALLADAVRWTCKVQIVDIAAVRISSRSFSHAFGENRSKCASSVPATCAAPQGATVEPHHGTAAWRRDDQQRRACATSYTSRQGDSRVESSSPGVDCADAQAAAHRLQSQQRMSFVDRSTPRKERLVILGSGWGAMSLLKGLDQVC